MSEENNELVTIEAKVVPAIMTFDFEQVRDDLKRELALYEIVVTGETVKGAKELATKLNKTAGAIDTRRKELVLEASQPIQNFDTKMKELVTLCKAGRLKITDQVATFEDETRVNVRVLLHAELAHQYEVWPMAEEFQKVTLEDLVIISNMTAKGNLTKAATEAIHQRVLACKEQENAVNTRLLELENRCYKAGLKVPLTRAHIDHLLMYVDGLYHEQLDVLIDAELTRQEQAEQQAEQQQEKKAEVKAQVKKTAQPKSDGRTKLEVTVKFDIDVAAGTSKEAVRTKLMTRLLAAGFKEDIIESVTIEEV